MEALAAQWAALPRDVDRLAAAEAWFRSHPFRYSLAPGDLREIGLDGFLFDQQVGFCGHYASGFTALMRAAGVPARVVSGHTRAAGRCNRLVAALISEIRQSDAHAWSEVWLAGEGWRQVDPTVWVGGVQLPLGDCAGSWCRSGLGGGGGVGCSGSGGALIWPGPAGG